MGENQLLFKTYKIIRILHISSTKLLTLIGNKHTHTPTNQHTDMIKVYRNGKIMRNPEYLILSYIIIVRAPLPFSVHSHQTILNIELFQRMQHIKAHGEI